MKEANERERWRVEMEKIKCDSERKKVSAKGRKKMHSKNRNLAVYRELMWIFCDTLNINLYYFS